MRGMAGEKKIEQDKALILWRGSRRTPARRLRPSRARDVDFIPGGWIAGHDVGDEKGMRFERCHEQCPGFASILNGEVFLAWNDRRG